MEKTTNKIVELDAVINEIEEWYEMYPDSDTAREVLTLLKRSVKKLPTYDKKSEILGKWIPMRFFNWFECSACCKCNELATEYCPNCGAKMDRYERG